MNIPISSTGLEKMGFEKIHTQKWIRGRDVVTYDGAVCKLNDERVYIDDIYDLDKRAINRLPVKKMKPTSTKPDKPPKC
jgi:hypothetical protein